MSEYVTKTIKVKTPKVNTKEWFAGLWFDAQGNILKIYKLKGQSSPVKAGLVLAKPIPEEAMDIAIPCASGLKCHRTIGETHICVC